MERETKQAIIGTSVVLVIILIAITAFIVRIFTPSNKVMELSEYYKVAKDEVYVILQDEIYEKKGKLIDGTVYLDYDVINKNFNKRFYWDSKENMLVYTTPTEVIKTEVGNKEYVVNKNKKEVKYEIVKTEGDKVYIALDFVKMYSDIRFKYYKNPNRVVVEYKWGDYLFSTVKKPTQLRVDPSIKSDIVVNLKVDDLLTYIDTSEVVGKGFSKVMTKDGIIGYVKTKYLSNSYYDTVKSNYKAPEYTNITKDKPVNLVWHQVTNMVANSNLTELLQRTKGVTTVSPTWFKVNSNEGSISSLASETYVEQAHSQGIEVWALVDDFNPDVNMMEVLSYSSRREKLINALIAEAIKYNLDGINVDFETIGLENGINFVQFIRELSVKCRNNGIVLSIDNYVPKEYSEYFDREEQGIVADYVIIMAYDEFNASSDASGPVASLDFVKEAIDNTLKSVPKEKTIIGVPFYTRLWKETSDNGKVTVSSEAYGMSIIKDIIKDNNAKLTWDNKEGLYYTEYNKDNATYKIWLEEEKSIEEKLKLINAADLAGVASWRLGFEDEEIWNVIKKYIN